jgi:uncharacterized protein (TIGR03382 family)
VPPAEEEEPPAEEEEPPAEEEEPPAEEEEPPAEEEEPPAEEEEPPPEEEEPPVEGEAPDEPASEQEPPERERLPEDEARTEPPAARHGWFANRAATEPRPARLERARVHEKEAVTPVRAPEFEFEAAEPSHEIGARRNIEDEPMFGVERSALSGGEGLANHGLPDPQLNSGQGSGCAATDAPLFPPWALLLLLGAPLRRRR